uniref:Phosphatidylinositol 4-kinase type 2 n=1 Tax=Panagrolaimus sp. JU765 TaxID=591449 RepID=A0AC34QZI3_9BILA
MVDVASKERTSSQDASGNNHQEKISSNNNVPIIIESDGNVITDGKNGDNGQIQETSNDTNKKDDSKIKVNEKNDENIEVVDRSLHSSDESQRTLEKKISKFVATSTRQMVTNDQDKDFNEILQKAIQAIKVKVFPQLIPSGSSGSYFVYDEKKNFLAVFKPKDEEPFAALNPKWPKFFQRILCFCCFGRACLIPNHGYLSETGASLVDDRLGLNIVPKTRIVKLLSPTFFYGRGCIKQDIKPKEGSFQLFVHGYKSAADVLEEWNHKGTTGMSNEETETFTILFQKLCILDYVIRNTDRHNDNWLIRHVPNEEISIAAIDNGLAFPVKHPEYASRFRKFPFNWSELSWAKIPLNIELRERLLNLLTPSFVHNLCDDLKNLFRHDKTHNRLLTYSQLRVFRGQLYNLKEALEANEPPSEWSKREPILVMRKYKNRPTSDDWNKCFKKKPADFTNRIGLLEEGGEGFKLLALKNELRKV